MKGLARIILAVVAAAVAFTAGCSSQPRSGATSPAASTLYWRQTGPRFDTDNVTRAQTEIPFHIILPTYVPKGEGNQARLPQITGPLKAYQLNDRVEIQIFYIVDLSPGVAGVIRIHEANFPVLAPPPSMNPGYHYVQIAGRTMIETQGVFGDGPGTILWFNQDNLYFEVGVYNFPSEDALKVAESLVS